MKVKHLVEMLQKMPPDVEVFSLSEEAVVNHEIDPIRCVWLSRDGRKVIVADSGFTCSPEEMRPEGAPTEDENEFWETPKLGEPISYSNFYASPE